MATMTSSEFQPIQGCGKSAPAKSPVENELRITHEHTVCYFIFKDNKQQDGLSLAFCAPLRQLCPPQPRLSHNAMPAGRTRVIN